MNWVNATTFNSSLVKSISRTAHLYLCTQKPFQNVPQACHQTTCVSFWEVKSFKPKSRQLWRTQILPILQRRATCTAAPSAMFQWHAIIRMKQACSDCLLSWPLTVAWLQHKCEWTFPFLPRTWLDLCLPFSQTPAAGWAVTKCVGCHFFHWKGGCFWNCEVTQHIDALQVFKHAKLSNGLFLLAG